MPLPFHTVEAPDGAAPLNSDKVILGILTGLTLSGTTNGSVTVSGLSLPSNYSVHVTATTPGTSAPAAATPTPTVYNKTIGGFTVILFGTSIAGTTVDVLIVA